MKNLKAKIYAVLGFVGITGLTIEALKNNAEIDLESDLENPEEGKLDDQEIINDYLKLEEKED